DPQLRRTHLRGAAEQAHPDPQRLERSGLRRRRRRRPGRRHPGHPEGEQVSAPKILVYDIETAPALADIWGMFNQNIGLAQLKDTQRVICWSAMWLGSDETLFMSEYEHGHEDMIYGIYD